MIPKFRIWEHDVKFMNDQVRITYNRFGDNKIFVEVTEGVGWKDVDEKYLMQSTGLHDKNGIEIYEGDILNHPLQGMRKVYYPFTDRVASYGLENIENGMRSTLQDTHRVYEVIGNIHEHPELLERDGE